MKKTIMEMFFLDEHNPVIDKGKRRFVYRHCSNIQMHKLKQLAEKLGVSLERLLVAVFAQMMGGYVNSDRITVVKRVNNHDFSLWESSVSQVSFYETLKKIALKKKSKKSVGNLDFLAVKFEIKVVKYKILFSYHYPEDFASNIFSSKMVYDYEKYLRDLLRLYQINDVARVRKAILWKTTKHKELLCLDKHAKLF